MKLEGIFIRYDEDTSQTAELLTTLASDKISHLLNKFCLGYRTKNYALKLSIRQSFHCDKYSPTSLRGSCILLCPEPIENKKMSINIQNEDNKRFKYYIECHAFKIYGNKTNSDRMSYFQRKAR